MGCSRTLCGLFCSRDVQSLCFGTILILLTCFELRYFNIIMSDNLLCYKWSRERLRRVLVGIASVWRNSSGSEENSCSPRKIVCNYVQALVIRMFSVLCVLFCKMNSNDDRVFQSSFCCILMLPSNIRACTATILFYLYRKANCSQ